MKEELKEKFEDFLILIFSILLDALIVFIVSAIVYSLKYALENWIFHSTIENTNNKALITIYNISKYFLIIIFILYVSWDIISQIIKIAKRIKK